MPHIAKDNLELLIIICTREPNPLHAQINRHRWSLPAAMASRSTRGFPPPIRKPRRLLEQAPDQRSLFWTTPPLTLPCDPHCRKLIVTARQTGEPQMSCLP